MTSRVDGPDRATPRSAPQSSGVSARDAGMRLDLFLAAVTGLSRSYVHKMISNGLVFVDTLPREKNYRLAEGETVSWRTLTASMVVLEGEPEIPLKVVHEDEHLVIIDKQPGLVMHPGPGHESGTVVNALIARYPEIREVGDSERPGVFHRIDRDTSGLVALARTQLGYEKMVELMKERRVSRIYCALVVGSVPTHAGSIDAPIGRGRVNRKKMAVDPLHGKPALTRFNLIERFGQEFSYLEVELVTGRTHQIRVHLSHIGHPVAGDPEYSRGRSGKRIGLKRQFLHAGMLLFEHPVTGEKIEAESQLPPDLSTVLENLRLEYQGTA